MQLDKTRLPFVPALEQNWRAIRRELDGLGAGDFLRWYDDGAYNHGWTVYGLVATVHEARERIDLRVRERCPRTMELLDAIPGLQLAAFSRLAPGSVVYPHEDGDTGAWRCHLPLRIPTGSRFVIEGQEIGWREGECVFFDHMRTHAVANESQDPRIVLIIDVWRSQYPLHDTPGNR